ncbi:type II CRISPR RNA-guided endonuclease Cas9 [Chitinophaga sp. sic0106]|uniref:type II CRISPR RNA-guided endonuclease Cas9 n=1 Tax=Chitinophaga sp. sic0106 TaxID=2854785 RepID=UPI001C47B56F|nr:type II CRISPR RNA-guided endonuclease Cas9 [Chitinophaga sp. sic0106]MBV7533003.1 hypothetical protein [Chitinophaga sp. sic0106]
MKVTLGLDVGTNSIGWCVKTFDESTNSRSILNAGSRIIPMDQAEIADFNKGTLQSPAAERTRLRSVRRLLERAVLRRQRLHRVLNMLNFLPAHYAAGIDFDRRLGQFLSNMEPKLAYHFNVITNRNEFLFKATFQEMLKEFGHSNQKLLPYDWTIYYLRKKALTAPISREELAWIILQFNQKRGYLVARGEEQDTISKKKEEYYKLSVTKVEPADDKPRGGDVCYNIHLENGLVYKRSSKLPPQLVGKTLEVIVSTDLDEDGNPKTGRDGKVKQSIRAPKEDEWILQKKRAEHELALSGKTPGTFIFDALVENPHEKIKGNLLRVIDRKFYKEELYQILQTQARFHPELNDSGLYKLTVSDLYRSNENHRTSIRDKGFIYLIVEDILFYQRPLKSKKSLVSNCRFESRVYKKDGVLIREPLKCIPRSHPLFQEFRLIKFVQQLQIFQRELTLEGRLQFDINVTERFLPTAEDRYQLFLWLKSRRKIDQTSFLKYPAFNLKKNASLYRWNYVEDRDYPCNETYADMRSFLFKMEGVEPDVLTIEFQEALWHILYSVTDPRELRSALTNFSIKRNLPASFADVFIKFPPFENQYGAYSYKATRKLLQLMRWGNSWSYDAVDSNTKTRIEKILTGEYDPEIPERVREKTMQLQHVTDFQGLPEWLATYIIYNRHAEVKDIKMWNTLEDLDNFIRNEFKMGALRNPVVEKLVGECLKLVREIWSTYGTRDKRFFDEIHIELGREMKNTKNDRKKITNAVLENEQTNLRIKALLLELMNDVEVENVRPNSPSQQEILKLYEEGVLLAYGADLPEDIGKISRMASPTSSQLTKYKLWLEQKYRSPYTGAIIPLNKLFTPAYEIEHILPKSRYYDDSLGNKVICEAVVNAKYKENMTAFEFINVMKGSVVTELSRPGCTVKILSVEDYEKHVKECYVGNKGKMRRLLMEDIPEAFIQRQLNDTRYISKYIRELLGNLVRMENEQEGIPKNVVTCSGGVTAVLRQHWGLNDVWNTLIAPRFERLNKLQEVPGRFGSINARTGKFLPEVPFVLQAGFSKKRIDHRHHALDAIVIACTSRDHINYLNNATALGKASKEEKQAKRYDLRQKLCFKKNNSDGEGGYSWEFIKPWESFTQDVAAALKNIIVSFRQSNRVINRTVNRYSKYQTGKDGKLEKVKVRQTSGDHWAVRKPLHQDTIYGIVKFKRKKLVSLLTAIGDLDMIVDNGLRTRIKEMVKAGLDKKNIQKQLLAVDKDTKKVEVYYWEVDETGRGEHTARRLAITEAFTIKNVDQVTDTGIQQILRNHLKRFDETIDGKLIQHPEIAFSIEGMNQLNSNIHELNNGKFHQPIHKVRIFEARGSKYVLGSTGAKGGKYVQSGKGTNLYFGIYLLPDGKRNYITIPLSEVIERMKLGLNPVPDTDANGNRLVMSLTPNDLVYVPTPEELQSGVPFDKFGLCASQYDRIYRFVSCTDKEAHFVPHYYAKEIDKNEMGSNNKSERSLDGLQIKSCCIKLNVNRLGGVDIATKSIISEGNRPLL